MTLISKNYFKLPVLKWGSIWRAARDTCKQANKDEDHCYNYVYRVMRIVYYHNNPLTQAILNTID